MQSPMTTPPSSPLARELDMKRAASMGFDVSGVAPEERCKYPSKFCGHMRARKSTGKLHRFCEYHRARANVNQKRWTSIRRRQEHTQQLIEAAMELSIVPVCAADEVIMSELAIFGCDLYTPPTTPTIPKNHTMMAPPASPTQIDATDLDLSDDEIDSLMAELLHEEKTPVPAPSAILTSQEWAACDDHDDALMSLLLDNDLLASADSINVM